MAILSRESEREIIELIDRRFGELQAFLEANSDGLDLISKSKLADRLEVSTTTISNWEKEGLRPYQPPIENTKKIYYRKSDVYKFLAVD